jgi:hypothetical protein
MVPSTPTGKPGRPKNAEQVIDADLDYATVHIAVLENNREKNATF